MGITLEGIKLSNLVIENPIGWTGVESEVNLSLGGIPIIWEQEYSGKPLDLVDSDPDSEWMTRKILDELLALAGIPKATYTLIYESTTMTIRFRNEDPPVISATALVKRSKKSKLEYYNLIRIKLMEI